MSFILALLLSSTPAIPEALTGAWGLSPADCATGPGAEGYLLIAPDSLNFYESRAQVLSVDAATENSAIATFEFSGEGETWRRQMSFVLSEDGKTLTRHDQDSDIAETIEYTLCG